MSYDRMPTFTAEEIAKAKKEAGERLRKAVFEEAVQEELEKIKKRRSFWYRIFPWKITIEKR